jgi:Protein of unknown function (DUF2827)
MNLQPLRIGITIGLRSADESLWVNGIKQNALNLACVLLASRHGHSVCLVNTTDISISDKLPWDLNAFPTFPYDEVKGNLDILIELGGGIDEARTLELKARGTRLVSYCCGSEYVVVLEAILFRRSLWPGGVYMNRHYDEIWVVPQVANSSLPFIQALRRCPAKVVPFVWDPRWLESSVTRLPNGGRYQPGRPAKRLAVMEPNMDVLKACIYPILIAETAFRRHPERIEFLNVCNAKDLAEDSHEFQLLMFQLDIVNANKATFLGRYNTADFLSEHADVVISNQWDNPLNYFYFDVCWLGYPLVHNAEMCANLGYYYEGNDVHSGAQQLILTLEKHDTLALEYARKQKSHLLAHTAANPELVATYDALIEAVMRR